MHKCLLHLALADSESVVVENVMVATPLYTVCYFSVATTREMRAVSRWMAYSLYEISLPLKPCCCSHETALAEIIVTDWKKTKSYD